MQSNNWDRLCLVEYEWHNSNKYEITLLQFTDEVPYCVTEQFLSTN